MRAHGAVRRAVVVGLLLSLALSVAGLAAAGAKKRDDLVVLDHERWVDTLKGSVKNFSTHPARDVTVVVKFVDTKRKPLGTQRVSVGDLRSGEQAAFSLPIEERNRKAKQYQFTVHAIWP